MISSESQPLRSAAADPEGFGCELQHDRDAVRLRMTGALDLASVAILDAQIRELYDGGCRRLIVDLSRLDFMDSTGLRSLLTWDAAARRDGLSIELVPGPPAVQRVFETTGTEQHLSFTRR